MFIVLFFVCLDGLPGEKRSGALKPSKIKENTVLGVGYQFFGPAAQCNVL